MLANQQVRTILLTLALLGAQLVHASHTHETDSWQVTSDCLICASQAATDHALISDENTTVVAQQSPYYLAQTYQAPAPVATRHYFSRAPPYSVSR